MIPGKSGVCKGTEPRGEEESWGEKLMIQKMFFFYTQNFSSHNRTGSQSDISHLLVARVVTSFESRHGEKMEIMLWNVPGE